MNSFFFHSIHNLHRSIVYSPSPFTPFSSILATQSTRCPNTTVCFGVEVGKEISLYEVVMNIWAFLKLVLTRITSWLLKFTLSLGPLNEESPFPLLKSSCETLTLVMKGLTALSGTTCYKCGDQGILRKALSLDILSPLPDRVDLGFQGTSRLLNMIFEKGKSILLEKDVFSQMLFPFLFFFLL